MTVAHLINRTPSSVLRGASPYEVLYGDNPSYESLRVFGSLCYTHLWSRDKDKFGTRSRRCVFVGYPSGQKGWKVFDLDKEDFIISRDVVFNEVEFPYAASSSSSLTAPGTEPAIETHDSDWNAELIAPTVKRGSNEDENVFTSEAPTVEPTVAQVEPTVSQV